MGRGNGHHSVSVVGGQGSQRMTDNQARNFRVGSERQSRDVLEQRQIRQQQMREQVSDALNHPATNASEMRARRKAINSLSREQIESTAGRLNMNQYVMLNNEQQKWYTDATNARNANSKSDSDIFLENVRNDIRNNGLSAPLRGRIGLTRRG